MNEETTDSLQSLIDRLRGGDARARDELFTLAYGRLRGLARKVLREDFPALQGAHEATSVANEAVVRLWKALEQVQPATVAEFFTFAALQVRRALLDLARKARRREVSPRTEQEPADDTLDPARLAIWTELHDKVDELPEDERQVMHLCWYLGLSQAEAARLLGAHPKEVSRRWVRAVRRLPAFAP